MILCVGTTPAWQRTMTFGQLVPDAVNRTAEAHDYASGKSINVARVLRTLGETPMATGFVGGDRGRALLADLDKAGISHHFEQVDAETRQCITLVDRSQKTATELVEESRPVEGDAWSRLDALVKRLLPKCDVCVFSGSFPPSAPVDAYARWAALAAEQNARVIVDARGESLRLAMRCPGLIVKLNREELGDTVGTSISGDTTLRTAMSKALPPGGAVVVTLGSQGAAATDGKSYWRISTPPVAVVSAVGSGDSFAAGLAAGFSRGVGLPDACALGAACGAANAMTAYSGHVSASDVERIRQEVLLSTW